MSQPSIRFTVDADSSAWCLNLRSLDTRTPRSLSTSVVSGILRPPSILAIEYCYWWICACKGRHHLALVEVEQHQPFERHCLVDV